MLHEPVTRRVRLGASSVEVPRLCLGLGSAGCGHDSVQGRLSEDEVARFLIHGHGRGATWWDTSDDYGTHRHVRAALSRLPRAAVQITTKTHAGSAKAVRESVRQSLHELGTDYVDVLLMHEVDTLDDFDLRAPALAELQRLKRSGCLGAVGLSTHGIDVLERAAGHSGLDVLLTNFNFAGVHMDADRADYERALRRAFAAGQGVCVMKTLGEGVLSDRLEEALHYNLRLEFVHGVLVGVASWAEVDQALRIWDGCAAP